MTPSVGACNSGRERQDTHVVQGHTLGASSRPYTRVLSARLPWGAPCAKVRRRIHAYPVDTTDARC